MSLLAARDFLLRHRDDYDAVYAGFHPPQLSSQWPQLKRPSSGLRPPSPRKRGEGHRL
jgi:hypothetical protein